VAHDFSLMDDTVPWELFQSISVPIKVPPLSLVKGSWIEDQHDTIISKKDTISVYDKANEWELRKKITNPYEAIFSGSETNNFPSMAAIHPLSRSYFKMVEMLNIIGFWDGVVEPFHTTHVCEGPGGFLQHIVEEAKVRRLQFKAAYAMTLKSTKAYIPGWKKSSRFLRQNPEIQLEYGIDMTGNILLPENQESFCSIAKESILFTADGGFDFSLDYAKQEESAFPLLLASFIMGLKCLKEGGTMIVKLFDIYSPLTRDLILGTAAQFKSFLIYKPATSRPCNSERYFIAQGFLGPCSGVAEWCKHLEDAQTMYTKTSINRLVSEEWSDDLLEAFREQIQWQEELQSKSIDMAIALEKEDIPNKIEQAIAISRIWCNRFKIPLVW
jgi:hypothetical protein